MVRSAGGPCSARALWHSKMDPAEVYRQRLAEKEATCARLNRLKVRLGNCRLVAAGLSLVVLWLVETSVPTLRWYTVGVLLVLFLASGRIFRRIDRLSLRATLAQVLYLPRFPGVGRSRIVGLDARRFDAEDENHPYATDADITGAHGLVDFVNIACTTMGARLLAAAFLNVAGKERILQRQQAVRELAPQVDFRERFFVEAARTRKEIRTDAFRQWAREGERRVPRWFRWACCLASLLVVASLVGLAIEATAIGWSALAVLLAVELALWSRGRRYLVTGLEGVERAEAQVGRMMALLRLLEEQRFDAPKLRKLTDALRSDGVAASRTLRGLFRRISYYEARRNQVVALVGPLVMYETQTALAVQAWMQRHSERLPDWIAAIARFEVYLSLSSFAFENPAYCYPEMSDQRALYRAEGLAHPLLGPDAVENDVEIGLDRPVLLVSGANMAGKSTLLRSIGINMALMYAGAPVRAQRMTVCPMLTVASIRVTDSLQKGESRFAAELARIRMVLERIRAGRQILVLVDELFAGTNSYDRFAGAVALMEFLARSGHALAVLSTHDRNVTKWAEQQSRSVTNMHFQDVLKGSDMHFDYKLKSGPAKRGNAVELMKRAGIPLPEVLPVPDD